MKTGIVSIFDNNNYGNRLQNYALQQTLAKYAKETVTIKNKPYFSGKSRLARVLPLAESVLLKEWITSICCSSTPEVRQASSRP